MKFLYLVRHAKSSRDDPDLPDTARPLNDRGLRDAARMGDRLAKQDVKPDILLCSPAVRALATAKIIAERLDYKAEEIVVDERLYAATPDRMLEVVRGLGEKPKCVMLVGHNPEVAALAHRWSDTISAMPTCAVAEFAFDAKSWSNIGEQAPIKVTLQYPKSR